MCGINGIWSRVGNAVDPDEVAKLRDTMRHRGPDGAGLWRRPGRGDVVLGHRRLAIVDLSDAGLQPMANEDASVQVTFNGEIYNHAELRADLESRGHRFRSRCDAEVLVHLYEEHGDSMVERLIGMFAFAIWDERRESLLLARDRLGVKPLYWSDDGQRIAFASEIKALVPLLARHEIDPSALEEYLSFVTVAAPRTLFRGVFKLPPATTMRIDRIGAPVMRTYWDPIADRERFDSSDIDWESELRFRLERSVHRRMMSDVPIGIFLSGGVDSSTNVAMFSKLANGPIDTFSIGFTGAEGFDELDWARQVSRRFGTRHHEVRIGADELWDFMPELVHHQDEPIADPVCVPLHFVSKLARENGITVVHVGEGADEIFSGYPTYVTAHEMMGGPWRRARALPPLLRSIAASVGGRALALSPEHEIHAEALARLSSTTSHLWWGGAVAFYERGLRRVTTPRLRAQLNGRPGPADLIAAIARDGTAAGARGDLDTLIYQDLRLRLPELLLMRVDKLTMANSLEARVPFLDHQVVELAMAMPDSVKIERGIGKIVLKRAVRDLLPSELIWRPKQGFGAPVAQWFRGDLGERLLLQLENSAIHELGFLDRARIRILAQQHASGRADRSFQLWNLLNLSFWYDRWIAGRDVSL